MNEDERLTRLEERHAHLQRHVAEQDKVMLALADELARVRRELEQLRDRTRAAGGEPDDAAGERPPHY